MQFAHSGSQTEKQPPPHPALPYDVTAGAPHSAESAPSHGAAPRSLQAPPHSAAPTPFHSIAPVPLHDAGYAPSHHAVPVPIRNTAPVPLHGAVSISTHGAVPVPRHAAKSHAAHSTALGASPPSALLQSCRKSGNKKVIKIATFLRLAIAADVQITDRAPKMKQTTAQCLISTLQETRKSR